MSSPESFAQPHSQADIIPQDISPEALLEILVKAGLPLNEYGKGAAKTVHDLFNEVREGESVMSVNDRHEISRHVNVLWLDVFCHLADGRTFVLKEDRQEFKDERMKRRPLDSSLGEKIKPGESPEVAAERALNEELGVSEYIGMYALETTQDSFVPDTFPGLKSDYTMHKYVAVLPEEVFVPEGYVEYQETKTNYYVWEEVPRRN